MMQDAKDRPDVDWGEVVGALMLSRDEVLLVTDHIKNDDTGVEEKPVYAFDLLLRLGSAYVEVTEPAMRGDMSSKIEVAVAFSEKELWLLRSKVTSGDKSASDALMGIRLLRKIYTELLRLNTAVIDFPMSEVEGEAMTDEKRAALRRRVG